LSVQGVPGIFLIMFLYGILIHSKSKEEHEKHLRILLQFLREHKLYGKLSRCIFYQNKIHYLGNIISTTWIEVDPEKIEAIRGWSMPNNVIGVRSFMGFYGYY
jgi:hypothetical protein